MITAGNAITINTVPPLATATLGVSEVQPFLSAYAVSCALPIRQTVPLHSPTLLSLGCALAI
jgi:hypothetical protein